MLLGGGGIRLPVFKRPAPPTIPTSLPLRVGLRMTLIVGGGGMLEAQRDSPSWFFGMISDQHRAQPYMETSWDSAARAQVMNSP